MEDVSKCYQKNQAECNGSLGIGMNLKGSGCNVIKG